MIRVDIPGFRSLALAHLVADYNGTLAVDGALIPGVADAFAALSAHLRIHVVTADTFGSAAAQLANSPVELTVIAAEAQAEAKLDLVRRLGADSVVALGNGRNDRLMLREAALGIVVIQREGAAADAVAAADVVSATILDALELLRHPKRLIATLRS